MASPVKKFLIWLLLLTPVAILLTEIRVLLVFVLLVFIVYAIGLVILKPYRKYLPFSIALVIALSMSIFGNGFFKEVGVVDVLPEAVKPKPMDAETLEKLKQLKNQ